MSRTSPLTTAGAAGCPRPADHGWAELVLSVFSTELGWMAVASTPGEVVRLAFGHRSGAAARAAIERGLRADRRSESITSSASGTEPEIDLGQLVERLERFAAGEPDDFAGVPIGTSHLTPFGRSVAAACRRVGWGETTTYGELAAASGRPAAARAVGSVMANNRVPLIVPCHRVLGAGGGLGGYSAPGGLDTKRRLLRLEGHDQ